MIEAALTDVGGLGRSLELLHERIVGMERDLDLRLNIQRNRLFALQMGVNTIAIPLAVLSAVAGHFGACITFS